MSNKVKQYDVIVLGGGAAGLFCAFNAGQRGHKVAVLEKANKFGKKILMSGGGRSNFTNLHTGPDNFISANPHFCKSALSGYSPYDFIDLVERHGIPYHEKKLGQLFCDDSAKDILNMLLTECEAAGVTLLKHCDVHAVEHSARYCIETSLGQFASDALVVATGGLSIPTLGGSDFGYQIAQQFNIKVLPTNAGLVPYTLTGQWKEVSSQLSGVSLDSTTLANDQSFRENILFTHRGLSGPAALQSSNYWQPGDPLIINLAPEADMATWLIEQKHQRPKALLRTLLTTQLPKALTQAIEPLWWPDHAERPIAEIANASLTALGQQLNQWQLKPAGTEGYRTAEVTLGGVDTNALSSKTMEAKQQPGLFFVGEVVDVTGWLGGYNFQWAWASGFAAASGF